jgi:hypothetical protein
MAAHAEYKKVLVNYNKLYKALKPIYHGTTVPEAVQPNSRHSAGKSGNSSGTGGGITMSDALQHTTTTSSSSTDSKESTVR